MKQKNRERRKREAAALEAKRQDRRRIDTPADTVAYSTEDADFGRREPPRIVEAPPVASPPPDRGAQGRARRCYWLTPRAWARRCSHCSAEHAVAVRPDDRRAACADCVDRLGITARESEGWRDGGAKAGSTVTSRHVDPATLRRKVKR